MAWSRECWPKAREPDPVLYYAMNRAQHGFEPDEQNRKIAEHMEPDSVILNLHGQTEGAMRDKYVHLTHINEPRTQIDSIIV